MRLDKFITNAGFATRSEAARAAAAGLITVDGEVCRRTDIHIDPEKNIVTFCGELIVYRRFTYIMMNKPDGYISSTDDPRGSTVIELLPERQRRLGLFPCGRLDKDTVGLLLLTNNGSLAHRLLSPKHHTEKKYRFACKSPLTDDDITTLESGVDLGDFISQPARVTIDTPITGDITLTEGKFHQIKRMFEKIDNRITFLERVEFAGIPLDRSLERGEWRYLTENETKSLEKYNTRNKLANSDNRI